MACNQVKPCDHDLWLVLRSQEDCLSRLLSPSKEGTDWVEYCNSFGPAKAGTSFVIWDFSTL